MPSPPYSFLQVEGTTPLSAEDAALLATILCPSPLPLPGENGVWRTPQPPAPSSPLEFGEGISAVFESLGLEATPTHQPSSRPAAVTTKSSPLSANSSPFIPTTSRQASESPVGQNRSNLNGIHQQATAANIPILPSSQAIPIPLPSLASHHPGTIHINNFTANLNMNYHGAVAQEQQQQQQQQYQHQQQQQPQYQQQQQFQQQQQLYQQQEQAAMAQQLHYQQQAGYPAMQGYAPAMGAPFMFVNMEMPVSSYQQGRSKEEGRGGGITFGSTPVVSVRAHTGGDDEGIDDNAITRTPASSSTPSSRSSTGYTATAAAGPFTPPSGSAVRLPTATPPHLSPQQHQLQQQTPQQQQQQTPIQSLQQQPPPAATAARSPTPGVANKSPAAPAAAGQQPPLQTHQHVPVQGVTPTSTHPPQNTKSNEISARASPVKNASNVPTVMNKTPAVESPKVEAALQVNASSAQVEESSQPQPEPSKSWASLFAGKMGSEGGIETSNKPTAVISPFSPGPQLGDSPSRGGEGSIVPSGDQALGGFLRDYILKHTPAPIMPRGLTNRSNWCFVNAILQALLACPPLHNLLRTLGSDPTMMAAIGRVKAPMLDAMLKFVAEFNLLEPNMASNARGQKKEKNKSRRSDIVTGLGLEPSFVFNMLLGLETDTFKVVEGRQEDAEEFLTCLLNGLSDEMTEQIKLVEPERKDDEGENDGGQDGEENEEEEGEDGWQEVGAKGKSCVTRRVAGTSLPATPIQALALGMCRSCVKVEGKDSSATLQPFYTLQLDIQDASIASVTDALLANFASEQLDGFVCGKTKQEVEATRSLSLEELPPVLILHLKRFVYDAATGGVQKVMKAVNFGVELEINKAMLSAECRSATTVRHRQYKLFSVVCHNGREATKGHYVTDVFHPGYSAWLHCDDGIVQPTAEELVLSPSASSTPYILFYRRCDTMAGGERRET